MTSCVEESSTREVDEVIENISKQRLSLRPGFAVIYNGTMTTLWFLRYILFCLSLDMAGTREELIRRIEDHEIKIGDSIFDPSVSKDPTYHCEYLLKAYLKSHGLSTSGSSLELRARVLARLGNGGSIFNHSENKRLIREAVEAVHKGDVPSEASICMMGIYGYAYDTYYKTFFNMHTLKRILGKTGFLEGLKYLASIQEVSDKIVFIPTE